jgi:hypothetical protein
MARNAAQRKRGSKRLDTTLTTSASRVANPDQLTQPVSEFDSAITAITFEASAGGLTAALTATTMDFGVRW